MNAEKSEAITYKCDKCEKKDLFKWLPYPDPRHWWIFMSVSLLAFIGTIIALILK